MKRLFQIIAFTFCINLSAQSIIFSRSNGVLNSGSTLDLMIYDPIKKTTKLLLSGTVGGRGEYNAVVSPDNKKIIFNTYRFSGWKLAIADFKDNKISNVKRFTSRPNYEYNPNFSSDGSKVAYQEFSWNTRDVDVFIADNNGNNAVHFIKSDGGDRSPDWARDSKSIIFTSARNYDYSIYSKSLLDKKVKQLTDKGAQDFAPSTSKTEDKIAFLSDRSGKINLYMMNLDGTNIKNLTPNLKTDNFNFDGYENSGCWAYKTSWSPNSKQIVFNALVNGNLEIFVVNSDGSGLVQITDNNDTDMAPSWIN
ncbi:hypothetical protein GCM10011531_27170 [Aquaticitalea lipolytica]|uniref:TolB protein n=1 Tax=Aquaticitalea lipolytica TaxID=1247562 RepID=A0A8J2XJF8_9FLAO|nr:PD40 domain-containing protein [Aquaticitalea lipolytica]GFZ93797.1 hypothetical protein GCM10011531_27170 [Aquaticitalea lipolytica]